MTEVILWVILVGVVLYLGRILYQYVEANKAEAYYESRRENFIPDLIFIHTCEQRYGKFPRRGRLLLEKARLESSRNRVPVLMTSGHSGYSLDGRKVTEAEYFRQTAWETLGYDFLIILGDNHEVRTTAGEVDEGIIESEKRGAKGVLVICTRPHLARVRHTWEEINENGLEIVFAGVYAPIASYFWEALTFFVRLLVPAGTRREAWLLDLKGRR